MNTSCNHRDLTCLFSNALPQLTTIKKDGPCKNPQTFALSSSDVPVSTFSTFSIAPGYWRTPMVGGVIYRSGVPSDPSPSSGSGDDPSVNSTITWGAIIPDP